MLLARLIGWIIRELVHRWGSALTATMAVTVAVALVLAFAVTQEANRRETRRITRDIGFNLRIIPASTDVDQFYFDDYTRQTLPEEAVTRLATDPRLAGRGRVSYNHLIAVLRQPFAIGEVTVMLTGFGEEQFPPGMTKPIMQETVPSGEVQVGHLAAQRLEVDEGDRIRLGDRDFEVVRVMPEQGRRDDMAVIGALTDVQALLGLDGRINEIQAIDCLCLTAEEDPAEIIRREIEQIVPEAQVFHQTAIADARARQRQTADRYASWIMPLVVLAAAAWVGTLAALNVRERTPEIGLLRALGYGAGTIGTLIMGRSLVIGALGGLLGSALGTWLALELGPRIFRLTTKAIRPDWDLIFSALWIAPLFAALCGFLPTMIAVTQEPARTLRPR